MNRLGSFLRSCTAGLCYLVAVANIPAIVQRGNAFNERPVQAIPAGVRVSGMVRARAIDMKPGLFDDAGARNFADRKKIKADGVARVRMNLFPDAQVDIDWSRVERVQSPSGVTWTGKVVGEPPAAATLTVSGMNVSAVIPGADRKMYQVRTAQDGTVWAIEIAQKP